MQQFSCCESQCLPMPHALDQVVNCTQTQIHRKHSFEFQHNRRALSFRLLLNRPAFLRSNQAPKHQLILDTTLWENSGAMGFLGMLIQVVWVGVILLATMIAATMIFFIALPNCNDICGKLTITYPYGITVGCYVIDLAILVYYSINCTTTNAYDQPQPKIGNISVPIFEGLLNCRLLN